ncbi:FAD-binding oxidoreductase, partial [Phenylobacterium sp.]|uniref:FAD-binding oxidoreductase n=1 Tax=Phenylobacterium sp. TaxID=1871053 RepID=UPI0037C67A40
MSLADLPARPGSADAFRQLLGADAVSDDLVRRTLLSQDIWNTGDSIAELVVAPRDTESLSRAVAEATGRQMAVAVRGGGMSYTAGYTPGAAPTVMIDLGQMDRILEINARDMTVTVEAGCTWKTLYETLKPLGLRTPFWGPLSGISSTIGGGLSQLNAIFGAGHYGTTSESVVGLAVVLSDGQVLRTGAAGKGPHPFYRHYGPDLTGLFCGDAGVFGVKAEITLRLIRAPAFEDCVSFAFSEPGAVFEASAEITRAGITCELIGFDPALADVRVRRATILSGVMAMGSVVKSGASLAKGVKDAFKMAVAGRGFLSGSEWSLHLVAEGRSEAAVAADLAEVRRIALAAGGRETEATIPRVIRAQPFTPLNNILGPDGERWVPIHGIVALSQAEACRKAIEALFTSLGSRFEAAGVYTGMMLTTLSTNAFLIEPVFFWPEARHEIHDATVEAAMLAKLRKYDANPDATALVAEARRGVVEVFETFG